MVERIRTLLETRQLTPTQFADLIGVARPIVSHILSGRNKASLEVVQRILAAMPELAMPWLLNGSGPMLAPAAAPNAGAEPVSMVTPASAPVPVAPVLVASVPATLETPALAALPTPSVTRPDETLHAVKAPDTQFDASNTRSVVNQTAPADNLAGKLFTNAVEPTTRVGQPLPFKASQYKPAAKPRRFVAAAPATSKASGIDGQGATTQGESVVPLVAPAPVPTVAVPELAVAPMEDAPPSPAQPPAATDSTPAAASVAPESAMAQALFAGAEKPIRRIVIFYRDGSFADYQPE